MKKLETSLPHILPLLLSFVLAFTAIYASATINASEGDCCGSGDAGSCVLDSPLTSCDSDSDCENGNFPMCCPTNGYCGDESP